MEEGKTGSRGTRKEAVSQMKQDPGWHQWDGGGHGERRKDVGCGLETPSSSGSTECPDCDFRCYSPRKVLLSKDSFEKWPAPGMRQEMHKMRPERLVVPERKEVLNKIMGA